MNQPVQAKSESAAPRRIGISRYSTVEFLIALGLLFMAAPFVEEIPHGDFIDGSLITIVLISGVMAVGRRRTTLLLAVILVAPVIIGRWLRLIWPDRIAHEFYLAPALIFVVFLIAHLLTFILRAPRVNAEVLSAGIASYLLLGMAWMFAYLMVAKWVPDAFVFTAGPDSEHVLSGFNAYYFSFITLTTVGYGDIVPVNHVARMLTTLEAITGTLFMAILIARLVSLYSSQPPGADKADRQTDSPS